MLSAILKHPINAKTLLTEVRYIQWITQKYFKNDKNIFSASSIRTFLTKCTRTSGRLTQSTRFLKPSGLPRSLWVRHRQTLQLDVNTNVQNNVILYKYEKNRSILNMKIFSIGQLIGWSVLTFYTYSSSFFDIFKTDTNLKEYIKNYGFRLLLFSLSILLGPLMCGLIYVLCARQVKYIILNKGGKNITVITYHVRKSKSTLTVPLDKVNCNQHRTDKGTYISFKIAGRSLFYLIEKRGTFTNPLLFDHTVGFARF